MEWWQILLIGMASIVAGVLLGALSSYLVKRFAKKRESTLVVEEPLKSSTPDLIGELIRKLGELIRKPETTEQQARAQAKREAEEARKAREAEKRERKAAAVVEEQPEWTVPDLLEELENNCKIATEPWTGKLLPFQTRMWDALQDKVDKLPNSFREDLAQVYVDIRLANNIVRLSTQFGHRSPDLDESYIKLCTSITERLNRIKPSIGRLAK